MIGKNVHYETDGSAALAVEDRKETPTNFIDYAKAREFYFQDELQTDQTSSKDIALAFLPCILVGLLFFI